MPYAFKKIKGQGHAIHMSHIIEVELGVSSDDPDLVYRVSTLLGAPTRSPQYMRDQYRRVFGRLVAKRCTEVEGGQVCIYAPQVGEAPRYYPVVLQANGTVIWYGGSPQLVAYPIHRAMDLGVHGVEMPGEWPDEVTARIDGWTINFYYDPILGRWIAATRYVLHNMRFVKGRLIAEEYGNVVNPYVETALAVAEATGVLEKLKGREGWTFSFVLHHREVPAALRPPEPSKWDWENYCLKLIAARAPDGRLLGARESGELLGLETVPILEPRRAEEIIREATVSDRHRSVFLRFGSGEMPIIIDVKSQYYEYWARYRHLKDGKAAAILAADGYETELTPCWSALVEAIGRLGTDVLDRYGVGELARRNPRKAAKRMLALMGEGRDVDTVREELRGLGLPC